MKESFVLGAFAKTSDPAFIEAMGYAGFDFVIIDLEHGPNSVQTVGDLVRGAECGGTIPIVRTKEDRLSTIGEVLDIGAAGVQAPQVNSGSEARKILSHARFAPEGMRGVCRFVRAAGYSTIDRDRYFADANKAIVVLQLEGSEAITNLDEILEVDGVDVLFIGPYDLSQSLGKTGMIDDPAVVAAMNNVVKRCAKSGTSVGTFVDTPENAKRWLEAGVSYLAYSVDVGIFADACSAIRRSVRTD